MNTRLQQFLSAENITQAQLADTLHVARAGISHILAGRNKPGYEFMAALMKHFPNLNMEWLMLGKGKMYKEDKSFPRPVEEINLFDDDDAPESDFTAPDTLHGTENRDAVPDLEINTIATTPMNTLGKAMESIDTQRKVSKIIVLFDDGTYQEM